MYGLYNIEALQFRQRTCTMNVQSREFVPRARLNLQSKSNHQTHAKGWFPVKYATRFLTKATLWAAVRMLKDTVTSVSRN